MRRRKPPSSSPGAAKASSNSACVRWRSTAASPASTDHLFDRGFISFEGDGRLLVSPVAHAPSLERMGVPLGERVNVGAFSAGQRQYLEFHREQVFLEARVQRGR